MSSTSFHKIEFDMKKNTSNVIKVIGVGGGGGNAVNHMFSQGLNGVDFVICNTDAQALQNSSVPNKIQLGISLTEGLGAGANPEIGKKSAEESIQEIQKMLSSNTKMVFITAGMGGGTGTGAAPVIAKIAQDLDLLTVGIVTIPFGFEGKSRREQAKKGVEEMRKYVDSMIVINNNKLRDIYGNLGFKAGFGKADEVLSTASRGIAEVITNHYTLNIDLKDAKTVLENSGTALMGSATASGENRAKDAITKALDSPLLDDNRITGAKNVLLLIVSGDEEVTIDEIGEINDYICSEAKSDVNIIMGVGENEAIGGALSVTVVATGFDKEQQNKMSNSQSPTIIHTLDNIDQQTTIEFDKKAERIKKTEKPTDEDLFSSSLKDDSYYNTLSKFKEVKEENKEIPTFEAPVVEKVQSVEQIDDFKITKTSTVMNEEEVEEESSILSEEPILLFDLPIAKNEKPERIIEKEDKSTVTSNFKEDKAKEGTIVHTLSEEYIKFEEKFVNAKSPKSEVKVEEDIEEEVTMTLFVEEPKEEIAQDKSALEESIAPFDVRLSELKKTSEERKETLKNFNYKFSKRTLSEKIIDEYERQPAYKRMGIELEDTPPLSQQEKSRTTLSIEDNDINLRSNNSFLHDNVD